MTPKQFHITVTKMLRKFNLTRLQTSIVYTYSKRSGLAPECTYEICIIMGNQEHIYVNPTKDSRYDLHLTIKDALDWCEKIAKEDETVLRNHTNKTAPDTVTGMI